MDGRLEYVFCNFHANISSFVFLEIFYFLLNSWLEHEYLFSFSSSSSTTPISIPFMKLGFRMILLACQHMKIALLASSHQLQEFLGYRDWFLETPASWMIVKIHFKTCQVLHNNALIFFAVETEMESFALVYLEVFQ